MAGAGGRLNKPRGKIEDWQENSRADFIKEISKYYSTEKKKWGAKGVSLGFSNRKRSGIAGGYTGKEGNKGEITISIPNSEAWSNHYRRQGRGTNPITEGKKIIRHEIAHHRQRLKEEAGKSTDKDAHGPQHKAQQAQIGGKTADRKPPKYIKPKGGAPNTKARSGGGGRRIESKPKPKKRLGTSGNA